MHILILTNHLKNYAGSEMQALEIYEYFKQQHYSVKVYANYTGNPIISHFALEDIITDIDDIDLNNFDFIWSQHAIFSRLFKNKNYQNLKLKIASVHLSPFEYLELSSLPYMAKLDVTFIANSKETKQKLLDFLIPESRIIVSNNAAPDNFNISKNSTPVLKKILIVSNHVPIEIREAMEILSSQNNIHVDFLGLGNEKQQRITTDILNSYDVIITIGKTVQYALLCQIPVYNYDHFGGCGYLSAENFEKAKYYNFSGRGFEKKTASIIVDEIINQYLDGYYFVQNFKIEDKESFLLSKFIENSFNKINFITLNESHINSIKLSFPLEERFANYFVDNQNLYIRFNDLQEINHTLNQKNECISQENINLVQELNEVNSKNECISQENINLIQELNEINSKNECILQENINISQELNGVELHYIKLFSDIYCSPSYKIIRGVQKINWKLRKRPKKSKIYPNNSNLYQIEYDKIINSFAWNLLLPLHCIYKIITKIILSRRSNS